MWENYLLLYFYYQQLILKWSKVYFLELVPIYNHVLIENKNIKPICNESHVTLNIVRPTEFWSCEII